MIACLQDLHNLHGQSSDTELPRLFFRHGQTKIQFTATDDHVPHDVIDRVSMHACACGDNAANIPADSAGETERHLERTDGVVRRKKGGRGCVQTMPASGSCSTRASSGNVHAASFSVSAAGRHSASTCFLRRRNASSFISLIDVLYFSEGTPAFVLPAPSCFPASAKQQMSRQNLLRDGPVAYHASRFRT